ncbi:MAG: UDP-glucose/GDP-mannose dehydrogenase family protein [Gammaproteobacteria bacterium]|nr:UDP-glucose/GDP-mannose dehydrogenase family protein [Gammaproteobacteria bacterium]
MKITVIGHSLEGITSASCLAEIGNKVYLSQDIDSTNGEDLFDHPSMQDGGLHAVFKKQIDDGRLEVTNEIDVTAYSSDLYVVTSIPDDNASLVGLLDELSEDKRCSGVIFTCSIPVGGLDQALSGKHLAVAYIPEFIREGSALQDFRNPHALTIGCESDALLILIKELYKPFIKSHTSLQIMTIKEAEFARFAVSAMLATRVSFMNELANITELLDIDIQVIKQALGSDPRIGEQYLNSGTGFGGRQLAEDLLQITGIENTRPDNIGLLNSVMEINERQKDSLFRKVWRFFEGDIRGRTFTVWGGAFKPNSSRIDNAPILKLMESFTYQGAILNIYDPGCSEELTRYIEANNLTTQIGICDNPYSALDGSAALLIVTEWREFLMPDFDEMKVRLSAPIIFDGRNIFEPERMKERGYRYFAIGRGERV